MDKLVPQEIIIKYVKEKKNFDLEKKMDAKLQIFIQICIKNMQDFTQSLVTGGKFNVFDI